MQQDFTDGNQFADADLVGASFEHSGVNDALQVRAMVADTGRGYSNVVQFSNPAGGKSSEYQGVGFQIDELAGERLLPFIVARNVGGEIATVTAKVPYTRANGTTNTINLPTATLRAGEIKLFNTSSIVQRAQQEQIKIASLEITYNTAPGSVIVAAQSVGIGGSLVLRPPMWDPFAQKSPTGGYPWRIEETSATKTYIKNITDREQDYVAYLYWENGGEYMIGNKKIAPHQTIEIDVKQLRDQQVTDEFDRVIPLYVSSGQLHWFLRGRPNPQLPPAEKPRENLALIGRTDQIDTINGISSNYACQNCCQATAYGFVIPGDVEGEVDDQIQFRAYEQGTDCYGDVYGPFEVYIGNTDDLDWNSSDDGIATVNAYGVATLHNAGDVEIEAEWDVKRTTDQGGYCPTPYSTGQPDAQPIAAEQETAEQNLVPDCDVCQAAFENEEAEADLVVRPKVTNVTSQGATRVTAAVGDANIFHFVTPKGAQNEQVTLTATLSSPPTQQVLSQISWEGATESANNPLQATITKDSAKKETVKIKYKGRVIKELRAWVVWTEVVERDNDGVGNAIVVPKQGIEIGQVSLPNARRGTDISFTFYVIVKVLPASIVDLNETNRPNLSGANISHPPGGTTVDGRNLSDGANTKWDMSRRLTIRSDILTLTPPFDPNLVKNDLCTSYPNNAVIGNDDAEQLNEELTNPYVVQPFPSNLGPGQLPIGQMLSADQPRRRFQYFEVDGGSVNDMYNGRLWFQEFARLEIEGQWHVISDPVNWRVEFKMLKKPVTEALWQFDANNDGVIDDTIITEAMINADANGDGDLNDQLGYWDNNASTSANNNSDIPIVPCSA